MPTYHKIVFLDRDGTLNVEKNYVFRSEDFEFLPGSIRALSLLKQNGFKIIVVSNQSGVARGYYSLDDVNRLEQFIQQSLIEQHAEMDAFFYCPHHMDGKVPPYNTVCDCRKPKTGLFERADALFSVDRNHSWMIGDAMSDMQFGKNAGLKTILVRTGYGAETEKKIREQSFQINTIVDDFLQAAMYIIQMEKPQ